MKFLLATFFIVVSTWSVAAENSVTQASPPSAVKGEVLEVLEVANFTYLRLNTKEGEVWAAVVNAHVKKGARVTVENITVMNNFESKSLKKVFPSILFGSLGTSQSGSLGIGKYMAAAHPGLMKNKGMTEPMNAPAQGVDARIAKAQGANAMTVEEIVTQGAALKGKSVRVRGKVVKYNAAIMGKNWIHLRDGSGSEGSNNNDILVTTTVPTKEGEIVTVKGIVGTDKDFGAGYAYKVLLEEATLE